MNVYMSWNYILFHQGIGADFTTMELRPSVHMACYGEFIQAVLAIVKKLDLSSSPPTATLQVY